MCGIVGYVGEQQAAGVLVEGLKKLEYRGYDSAGIAIHHAGDFVTVKTKGRLKDLEEKIKQVGTPEGTCGIGHTRWATHGEPSDINSHPHGNARITIVHNGIIENYMELKTKLLKKGYSFLSETDTEVVAKLLDYYYKGDPMDAIKRLIMAVKGSYALGIMFRDIPEKIFALRKDSPLIIGIGNGENFIASDIPAVLKYTNKYQLLDENLIAVLEKDSVTVYTTDGETVERETLTADWDVEAAEKDGYPHFMLKEIFEQTKALNDTISPRLKNFLVDFSNEKIPDSLFENTNKIHIVACGTAMHAGMIGKNIIEALARVDVDVQIASEFRYRNPIFHENDLMMVISQSGETADTLAALRLAKQQGITTLAVVNVVGSSIAREADYVIYTWAGPEIAVASTKAYTVQLGVMYLLAIKFALAKCKIDLDSAKKMGETLLTMPSQMQKILEKTDDCKYYASRFQNAANMFFIGRGLDYAISLEGSLKLKEISYMHSEAYAAGELKHGTISLMGTDVPVIAVATQSDIYEKTVSNIKEVVTRGAKVLLIVKEGLPVDMSVARYVLSIPNAEDIYMPLLSVIPLQLFAYYTAVLRGCDVDQPRNLAKSVTVE